MYKLGQGVHILQVRLPQCKGIYGGRVTFSEIIVELGGPGSPYETGRIW